MAARLMRTTRELHAAYSEKSFRKPDQLSLTAHDAPRNKRLITCSPDFRYHRLHMMRNSHSSIYVALGLGGSFAQIIVHPIHKITPRLSIMNAPGPRIRSINDSFGKKRRMFAKVSH